MAYYFPPDGGGGTQRPAKFCKYLPEHGWLPVVVSRPLTGKRGLWNPEDTSLAAELAERVQVLRACATSASRNSSRHWRGISSACDYLWPMYATAMRVVEEFKPQAILITMSPFDLCIVGQRLAVETGLPVVYDLRDPWAMDGWRLYGTRRRWRRDYRAMVDTLSRADGVIANTPEAARALCAAVPDLRPERVVTIPNGYDAEDFAKPVSCPDRDRLFRLVHTGTLHSEILYKYEGIVGRLKRLRHYRPEPIQTSGRTALHLFAAIRLLQQRRHPLAEILRVVLVGPVDAPTRRCIAESGVADRVEVTGYLPHGESVARLRTADALFLPLHGLPAGRRSLIVPGKTYEYLAAGRPILGCLPPGDARDLVERSGRGVCADPCNPEDIARALVTLHDACQRDTWNRTASEDWLTAFERRTLTGRLAQFLESVTQRPTVRGEINMQADAGAVR